ncbi:hypothetical protein [Chryseobacterium sp.]|jgi:hypothetical protein|uniref:hypothetical protein n=1 Tax=Chryseobacterium sp. TaxID=1871047 RepID=UPI0028428C58|nr:hypothetical protein [Chryseobacterium sp.]MDR3025269.1 hypothetical protein [Chryseobacterium sp.]
MKKKVFRISGIVLLIVFVLFAYKAISILVWAHNANKNFYNLTLKAQLVDENGKEIKTQGNVFLTKYVCSDDYDLDPIADQQIDIITINREGKVNDTFLPLQGIVVDSINVSGYKLIDVKKERDYYATKDYDTVQMKFVLTKQ